MRGGLLALALVLAAGPAGARTYGGREVPDGVFGAAAQRIGVTIDSVNVNDANGFSPIEFLFIDVTITGVVQLAPGSLDPFDQASPSTWFYVADGTGGVAVAWPGNVGAPLVAGDSVQVTGKVFTQGAAPIRGTRTIDLGLGTNIVTVLGPGTVDAPVTVPAADIVNNGAAWEGTRVRVAGLTLVNPGAWPGTGANGFVTVTDGTDSFEIYIDADTDLDGVNPPSASFDLVGFVAEDDPAPPFTAQHYVWPTAQSDLISGDGSGVATVTPAAVPEDATGLSLDFRFTGQQATLETIELDIPAGWSWTPSAADSLSGPGFLGATLSSFGVSPITVQITGAAVTSAQTGTLTLANLDAPVTPGLSTFVTRTAIAGGTPSEITASPAVNVVTGASPGDVVINEVYSVTRSENEEAEFIELYNRSTVDFDISGWTLGDVGRSGLCDLDVRWAFPLGTVIQAGGYVVACRTALDPQGPSATDDQGFLIEFPSFPGSVPLFEMFDLESAQDAPFGDQNTAMDDPGTPNLVLLADTPGVDDQIALLGGLVTNAGQCESPRVAGNFLPFSELIVLQDVLGAAIDALEYRELGPCDADICTGPYTGPDDAYPYGAPKSGHTLGRDANGSDTDVSANDVFPSSAPTPGARNVPGDTVPPGLLLSTDPNTGAGVSDRLIDVRFDEPVTPSTATNPGNYSVTGASGEAFQVLDVFPDSEEAQRRYLLVTEPMPPGFAGTLNVAGVTDLVIAGTGGNVLQGAGTFQVPAPAMPVCSVQDFDDVGFSPFVGDTVVFAGFVTLGDIPAAGPADPAPRDRVSIWVQEPGGCGVNVFAFLPDDSGEFDTNFPDVRQFGVQLNDVVRIRGRVTEFVSSTSGSGAVTEVEALTDDPDFYHFLVRNAGVPEAVEVKTGEASDEGLEGTLVHTVGTVINSNDIAAWIDDGSGSIQVFQNFSSLDLTKFTIGDVLDVTGIITQFDSSEPFFSGYELVPQNQDAVFKVQGGFSGRTPVVRVEKNVLVPEAGETIEILTRSPRRSEITIEIYDAVGRKITTLYDGVGLGELRFEWDGRGQDGSTVDPGVYLCHARSVPLDGGRVETIAAPIVVGLRLNGSGVSQ